MFGVSTFCLHNQPLSAALHELGKITRYVEIMDEGLHFLEDSSPLASHSLHYTLHAPSRGVNIASLLEPIRRASVEVTGQCFEVAADVGASVIVHPGYFAWEEERPRAELQLKRSIHDLTRMADDLGIQFFLENMGNWNYFFLKTPDEMPLLDGTGFALDVGHAHLNHCLPAFLEYPIRHIHLHDNDGKEDTHMPVGAGTIDFLPVMKAVEREKIIPVIEVDTLEGVRMSISALDRLSRV
ncbi:sugar phosphate isomerase/epimerase [Methanolinea mesophila]|uniref:sugar phosphate isomerase/epimerase family protein n=1 Tax=Methanolinea mesophila TaxID=547055 RepID=UPI001AE5ECB8|nr:sugar phosphate isomerase/epimerase family protein [Methanolinea mesophila]MBP1929981.1 sugar phosphate isomerase/epimerase [Methanolinea mesophila]